ILTVVDRLSKERHYIPCTAGEEGTSAEETAKLFLRWVYRTHGLPDSIVSDRGTQFVSLMWKSLCTRLGITSKLSTAYHPHVTTNHHWPLGEALVRGHMMDPTDLRDLSEIHEIHEILPQNGSQGSQGSQ